MIGTDRPPAGIELRRMRTRRRSALDQAGGLLSILAALVLWAWILASVLTALRGAAGSARAGSGRECVAGRLPSGPAAG